MTTSTEPKIWADESFMALSKDGHNYEFVNGELVDTGNSGMKHGEFGAFLAGMLSLYARQNRLGVVCDSSTAFALKSGNKRSPDVSFVAKELLKGHKHLPKGYFQGAPDLAVEILSPNSTIEEIHDKIVEYFENGTRLIWVIHPDEKLVLVYHAPEPHGFLRSGDSVDGESVIPSFSLDVKSPI